MKIITQDQINVVLQTIYQTNISVSTFDAIKKLFSELPNENKPTDTKTEEAPK